MCLKTSNNGPTEEENVLNAGSSSMNLLLMLTVLHCSLLIFPIYFCLFIISLVYSVE